MNKPLLFLFVWLASIATLSAQQSVEGVAADSASHSPLPYATVRLFAVGNAEKPVSTFLTDANGRFSQQLKTTGQFRAVVSSVGMQNAEIDFALTPGQTLKLDTVFLSPYMLGTATVTAQRPVVKMETDKVTYDLTSDADSKSSTLLDMLRKVPLVTVDGQDNITVNGSSNFKVYVDGKPNPMLSANASLVMKSIPASYAKNIEVITNPGAKYDAEGVGGILNITTNVGAGASQTDLNGYSASLSGTVTTRGEQANGFFSWQKGKFSMSLNAAYNAQRMNGTTIDLESEQYLPTGNVMATNMSIKQDQKQRFFNGGLNLSYQIDSLRLITAAGSLMQFNQRNTQTADMLMALAGVPVTQYEQQSSQKQRYTSVTANLDYQRSFAGNRDRFLTLSYQFASNPGFNRRYSWYTGTSSTLSLNDDYSDNDMSSTEHSAQIDYTTPLAKQHKLSVGAKFIGRINGSDSEYYLYDGSDYVGVPSRSVDYHHYNDIGSAYAEYEGTVGKFKLKGGLRYEHTWQRVRFDNDAARNFNLNYGNLVPSATLTYQIADARSLGVSYNMRIMRPGIYQLNPYKDYSNPTSVTFGNTDLDAEKTHNLSLVYSSFSPKLIVNANLHYNFCDNGIEQYMYYDDNGVRNETYGNLNRSRDLGLNLFLNYRPLPITSLIVNAGCSYVDLRSPALDRHNSGWQGNLMVGLQQTLWWKLKLSANFITMTRRHTLQGWHSGFGGFMGSLTKSFMNDFLTVGIAGFMPLRGEKLQFKIRNSGEDFSNCMCIRVPVAQIGITCSIKLGNVGQKTKAVNRSIENNDLMERQSGDQTGGMGSMGSGVSM